MEELVTVLSVKAYSFTNDKGEELKGCTVHYYPCAKFDKKEEINSDGVSGTLGLQPLKCSMPFEFFNDSKKVGIPCMAKVEYVMRNVQGQMVLKPDKITYQK